MLSRIKNHLLGAHLRQAVSLLLSRMSKMIGNLMSGLLCERCRRPMRMNGEGGEAVSGIQGGHKVVKAEEEDEGLGRCWSAH